MSSPAEEYLGVKVQRLISKKLNKKPRVRTRRPQANLSSAPSLREGPFLDLDWCLCSECQFHAVQQRLKGASQ